MNVLARGAAAQSQSVDIRPQAHQLVEDELRNAFKGWTHDGSYNFDSEGLASRFYVETHHADGRLTYREGLVMYEGRWFMQSDGICFTYAGETLDGGCFRVYRLQNCYYFYSKHRKQFPNEIARDYWTARSVIKGETAECVAAVS